MTNLSVDRRVQKAISKSEAFKDTKMCWEQIAGIIAIVVEENQNAYCQGYSRGYNDGYEKAKESV